MSDAVSTRETVRLFAIRLAIGLVQGLVLLWLYRTRETIPPLWAPALVLTAAFAPIVALGSVGRLRTWTLAAWLTAAAALTLGLGLYAGYVHPKEPYGRGDAFGVPWALFIAAALYILHHLITAADAERRWRASYDRYFDESWLDAVRLALAAAFVGALWLLLFLGAALFKLIGVDVVEKLIREDWFAFPITASAFAAAIHITDVRVQLVRGARTLALTLLSWLLPILTVLVGAFLLTVPFTGLKPLWDSVSATATMLAVSGAFVVLINAVYQDGGDGETTPFALRWAARVAGVLLAPMVAIAAYSLTLRIGQYGLSPARIYAATTIAVASVYAAGYLWAAVVRGPWMKPLETTNWIAAHAAVTVIVLLFSPVLDPARLSVGDQIKRLADGRIAPPEFDYRFLHFESGRWGREALAELAAGKGAGETEAVAEAAKEETTFTNRWSDRKSHKQADDRSAAIATIGAPLPSAFFTQSWTLEEDPLLNCRVKTNPCHAVMGEVNGRPGAEIIVIGPYSSAEVFGLEGGRWKRLGQLEGSSCKGDVEAIRKGEFRFGLTEPLPALIIDGRAQMLVPSDRCPDDKPAP